MLPTFRMATKDDLKHLVALEELCLDGILERHEGWPALEQYIKADEYAVLIAEQRKKLIAFIITRDTAPTTVVSLIVHPDHRRQGIAEAMARAVLSEAPAFAIITSNNYAARALAFKLNFEPTGHNPEQLHRLWYSR